MLDGRAQGRRLARRRPTHAHDAWIVPSTAIVNQYYVYAVDADFGPFFLKLGSYFPYTGRLCLNGHERAKRQLDREGIAYEALDNGFASCADPPASRPSATGSTRLVSIGSCASGWPACRTPTPTRTGPRATATS